MDRFFLIIDESGAKGYADQQEQKKGELGVMAGYIIPEKYFDRAEREVRKITDSFTATDKMHITDLDNQQQEDLRGKIYSYLNSKGAKWFYDAQYVDGLNHTYKFMESLKEKSKKQRRSNIKISESTHKDSLHVNLFEGVFSKAIAFCMDHGSSNFELIILTDKVDKSILKEFENSANHFLNILNPYSKRVTGFDPDKKEVVDGYITSEIINDNNLLCDLSGIKYNMNVSESPLTIVADILANSVHYHLQELQRNSLGCPLNTRDSIKDHPLSSLIYGVSENNDNLQTSDTIFGYSQRK